MDFRDSLSAEMPAPRDDEPAGLRQGILDELADHLACSYNRELLRGASPDQARRRAIERFGNPAAVARRLWLDAMRGKIMAQRVLIATCLVVMAACLGIVGLVWSQSNRSAAQAVETNRRLVELVGQTQATNQEMLRQLQAMAKPAQPAKSADWIPVKFHLRIEKAGGPPAVGYEVVLGRGNEGSEKADAIHRSSDATGLADFGVVQPGDWEYTIQAGLWKATGGLNAIPGTAVLKEIACPKAPPEMAQVKVRANWPGRLADKDIIAVASFTLEEQTYQPPLVWSIGVPMMDLLVIGRPRGRFTFLDEGPYLTIKDPDPSDLPAGYPYSPAYVDRLLRQGKIHGVLPLNSSAPVEGPLEVLAGRYSLERLMLFRIPLSAVGATAGECPLLSASSQPGDQGVQVHIGERGGGAILFLHGHQRRLSPLDQSGHFEARPGQTAEWVISLPDEMIREAEKQFQLAAPPEKSGQGRTS